MSLVLPAHAIEFIARPAAIFAFVVTFTVVVRFWFVHNAIFEHYFVPNRAMTATNFIALASLILQVFCLQLYLHFVPRGEGAAASRIYFAFFALSYGVQGVMLGVGLFYRRKELAPGLLRRGLRELACRTGLVAGSIAGNAFALTRDVTKVYVAIAGNRQTLVADLPTSIVLDAIAGSLLGYVLYRVAIAVAARRAVTTSG